MTRIEGAEMPTGTDTRTGEAGGPAPSNLPGIGHNCPPLEPTPFDESREEIEGLYMEAANWLDGSGINSQADAEAVSKLVDLLRKASARADERRKAEAKPFDDAKAEIQARYNTLIGDTKAVKGKAVLALDVCKKALVPWLRKQEEEQRARAEEARRVAEEKERAAQAAFREAAATADLSAREEAEAKATEAKAAEIVALRAEKQRPQATGGTRAMGLRRVWRAEIVDQREFARFCWEHHRSELDEFLCALAGRLVSQQRRDFPGVRAIEDKTVA